MTSKTLAVLVTGSSGSFVWTTSHELEDAGRARRSRSRFGRLPPRGRPAMSWKTLVVLAVLVAGLGGFLIVDNQWLAPKREKAESAKGRLWMVEPKDVESFAIARKDDTIKLKRVGDGWEMVEPVKTRA